MTLFKKQFIISGIAVAALSFVLLAPFAIESSNISKPATISGNSFFNNYESVGGINHASYNSGHFASSFDIDLLDEDFTGDAAP